MALSVAFLRAINVGNRRVSKDRLTAPLVELGFDDVSTFIASGNVIFRSRSGAEPEIEAALTKALGFEVVAFVRSATAVAKIADGHPFPGSDDLVHAGFVKRSAAASARRALEALGNDDNEVRAAGKEIFWLAKAGMGRATVSGASIEKAAGQPATFRSVRMLKRLAAKLS